MDDKPIATAPQTVEGIRRADRELAAQLSTRARPTRTAELLQLAAIYAELPESRREHWFKRLSAEGVSPQLLEEIVDRASREIRFATRAPEKTDGAHLRLVSSNGVSHRRRRMDSARE